MKIAIITPQKNSLGGVGIMDRQLSKALRENGHEIMMIDQNDAGFFCRIAPGLVKPLLLSTYANKKCRDFDLVICNGEYSFGIKHKKCVNIFHGSAWGMRKYLKGNVGIMGYLILTLKSFIQIWGAKGKYVVAVSEFAKNILEEQGIVVDSVIENCVDTEKFKPSSSLDERRGYIFLGYSNYYAKGFDVLKKLSKKGLQINCVTDRNPGEGLGWIKKVENEQMPGIYNKHKICIFPSRFEALQLTVLEAMSCGLPVVMSKVGVGLDVYKNVPEFVVDGWDDRAVDEYFERIKTIESNYQKYSLIAREYVLKNYNYKEYRKKWSELPS